MKLLVAMIALFACWTAAAATLPQVPAGGTLGDLDKSLYQCRGVQSGQECRRQGRQSDRIADQAIVEIVFFYRDESLVRSVFAFKEAHFDDFVARLTRQLGAPESGSEGLKAGMGGVFPNHYHVWKSDGQVWFVEQYFERISISGLWVMNDAEFEALQAERESMRFRGARDL